MILATWQILALKKPNAPSHSVTGCLSSSKTKLNMEAFRKLLRAAPQEHAINPSDDIYPLTAFDQIKPYQMVLGWSMRFNDVLDAAKLGSSLSELLEMGDWRKLGGRLRRNVS